MSKSRFNQLGHGRGGPLMWGSQRDYKIVGATLVAARRRANLTQQELATRLEKSQSLISDYERGKRRIDAVEFLVIARTLGSTHSTFLERSWRQFQNARARGVPRGGVPGGHQGGKTRIANHSKRWRRTALLWTSWPAKSWISRKIRCPSLRKRSGLLPRDCSPRRYTAPGHRPLIARRPVGSGFSVTAMFSLGVINAPSACT
jgi:hypothetical protein